MDRLEIVVWGDYTNPHTQELDRRVRAALEGDEGARYSFRHYPLNSVCNPHFTRKDGSPTSCLASRAVEAAGRLGGTPAAWKMHDWLMETESFTTNDIRRVANSIGLDPTLHRTRMQDEDLDEIIAADARAASQMGLASIPFVFVNDRRVPRWRHDKLPVIETILEEARAEVGR